MKSIKALFVILIALTVATTASAYNFNFNLELGSSGPDVVALQTYLESNGYLALPAGTDKGYFGASTQTAVATWQNAQGIAPSNGYFGPVSRSIMTRLTNGGSTDLSLTSAQIKWIADTLLGKNLIKKSNYNKVLSALGEPRYVVDPIRPSTKLTYPTSGDHTILSYNRILTRDLSQERSTQPFNWKGLKLIITDTQKLGQKGMEITEAAVINDEIDFFLLNESGSKMGEVLPIFMNGLPKGEAVFVKGLVSSSNYNCTSTANCGFSVVPAGKYSVQMSIKDTQEVYYSDYFTYKDTSSLANVVEVGSATYKAKMVDDLDVDGCIVPVKIGNNYNVCDYYQNGTAVSRMNGGFGGEYSMNVGDSNKIVCNFTENTPVRVEKNMPACVRPSTNTVTQTTTVSPVASPVTSGSITPSVSVPATVAKLSSAQLCSAIKMTTADSCSGYTAYSQRQSNPSYVYNGVTYNLSYTLNKNAAGARCNDLCSAVAK